MNRLHLLAFALLSSLFLGCSDDAKGGSDSSANGGTDTGDDTGGGTPPAFAPTDGNYLFDYTTLENTCPTAVFGNELEDATGQVRVDEALVEMTIDFEGVDTYTCAVAGSAYTCPTVNLTVQAGADVTVLVTDLRSGAWSGDTAFTGTSRLDATCEGVNCDNLGMDACTMTVENSAAYAD